MEGNTMFETPITVVGNIVTKPDRKWVGDQELIKFRVASNSRRRTPEGNWEPGNSLFVTVNCWGKLVTGVGAGLGKGDAVIVVGCVYTSEYEDREGVRRSSVEVRATSVGPDLARCIARIETRRHSGSSDDGQAAATSPDQATGDDKASGDDDAVDGDSAVGGTALPLSA
jgi:single-strand DNA-binding protein